MRALLFFIIALFAFISAHGGHQKSLLIATHAVKGVKPWDPDSIKKGITGSEEAVIYMSQKLANIGYRVVVLGNPPKDSPHKAKDANPRFVGSLAELPPFDIAISWRNPSNGKALRKLAKKIYLWPHDSCFHRIPKENIEEFDDVLWLSNWQREQWSSINPPFSRFEKTFGNGINLEQFGPVRERTNPYSCVYGSNYALGLETLLDIWPMIKEAYPAATLDIYYGWQHWGLMSSEKEEKLMHRVASLASLDVRDHGLVSHDEINRAYETAGFWTYPLNATETFCITALKAQTGGAVPVVLQKAALKESCLHGYTCEKTEDYAKTLLKAMSEAQTINLEERKKMRESIGNAYTWEKIALKWNELFSHE
jgi:glycosyltransferase involved in cell wall biosynthesis